jgi:group I intron endonuclease
MIINTGIYIITNTINGKCYVGSSIHLDRRRLEHFSSLKSNKHHNNHLQQSYNKHGRDVFEFSILESFEITDDIKDKLLEREQFWIDNLKPEYNILQVAGSCLGFNHSDETKEKISNTLKGVKKSEEHVKNIRKCQKGKIVSEETKEKLSKAYDNRRDRPGHTSKIFIDDVLYNSIKDASEILNISYSTIQGRLTNENFQNYRHETGIVNRPKNNPKKGLTFKNTPVIIDGIAYLSAIEASKSLGIKSDTIKYRIASKNFENYKFLND